MKSLILLLGSSALTAARVPQQLRPTLREVDLPPLATTPQSAAAWRRWAETGRAPADQAARQNLAPKPLGNAV